MQTKHNMSKLITISLDVTKIPRDKIKPHKNGSKYVSLDIWVNDEPDKFDNDCSVNITQTKDEREAKDRKTYCGNGRTKFGFNKKEPEPIRKHNQDKGNAYLADAEDDGDEIPF